MPPALANFAEKTVLSRNSISHVDHLINCLVGGLFAYLETWTFDGVQS
jgi:hypothetical protein